MHVEIKHDHVVISQPSSLSSSLVPVAKSRKSVLCRHRALSADPAQSTAESHTTPRELAMSITSPFSDLYEPIDVIGNGSFGIIRKVRRKQDGVVSNPF